MAGWRRGQKFRVGYWRIASVQFGFLLFSSVWFCFLLISCCFFSASDILHCVNIIDPKHNPLFCFIHAFPPETFQHIKTLLNHRFNTLWVMCFLKMEWAVLIPHSCMSDINSCSFSFPLCKTMVLWLRSLILVISRLTLLHSALAANHMQLRSGLGFYGNNDLCEPEGKFVVIVIFYE